jgi:TolA-binding protein
VLHRELGDEREARRVLERVVNTWPDSGAAELARQVLREIG